MRQFIFIFFILIPAVAFGGRDNLLAIDIPLMTTRTLIIPPPQFSGFFSGTGKFGYDFGLGLKFNITHKFKVRGGFHYWNKPFNAEYLTEAIDYSTGNVLDVVVNEDLDIGYFGLYARTGFEWKHFFIEGGFDFSFTARYHGQYRIYDFSGNYLDGNQNAKSSGLSESFYIQADLVLSLGPKFTLGDILILKPTVELTLPYITLFPTGAYTYNSSGIREEVGVHGVLVKIGLNIGFELGKKKCT